MFGIGWMELLVLGLVAVLIFGKRLPEVGRNLGKGIIEFKKGLSGIEDDVNKAGSASDKDAPRQLDQEPTANRAVPHDKSTGA